jgi:leader peptidase (prepilin peptidase) / N-methyltransferase
VSLTVPDAAVPLWLVLALALAGGAVGLVVASQLADGRYRHLDERGPALPRHRTGIALATALAWGSLTWRFGDAAGWAVLPAYLYLGVVGVALASIDLDVHRLPDVLVLPSAPAVLALLAVASGSLGQWWPLARSALAALLLFAGYFLLMVLSPGGGGLGFGDVKLALVLGLLLGWVGWGPVVVSVAAAFVLGGLASVVLLALRRVSRQSSIAFGPAMIAGALVALVFPVQVLTGAS